jgi:hypothetical protein
MVNGSGAAAKPDSLAAEFDDERLVANAGLVLTATLSDRLRIERLVDETVDLGERPGAARPGRKVLSLLHAMAAGADSIDDCDLLRAGETEAVLGHKAMAPSTLGTFLRSFTSGTCASSTAYLVRRCGEPGRRVRARPRGGSSSTSTASSARSTVTKSGAPPTAIPASAATTP